MSTSYPAALDTFAAVAVGTSRDGNSGSPKESTLLTNLGDAVEAIEAALGLAPKGSYASVVERLNTINGFQNPAFAASFTPAPLSGGYIKIGNLTNNITINDTAAGAHLSGLRMTIETVEDGTGGRTITFNAAYKGAASPTTTANKINIWTFVWNGANWMCVSSSVNI